MRITTKLTLDMNTGAVLEHEYFEYDGPVAECKKGRGELQGAASNGGKTTNAALGIAGADNGIQGGYRGRGDSIANNEVNTQGGLSPLVAKQLASEQSMIGKSYSDASRAADRGLSMRGMGVAPSGLTSSIRNTAINNAGQAQTNAVGNAFGVQNQLNNGVLNYDVGQQSLYDPLRALHSANEGVEATTGAASALNKAGSTLGDIGSGIGTLAGIGGQIAGLGGFKGIGKSVMG